ncbi:MAG TPA: pitrilysin family protein [Patescibacteria group bacterium]|nr:pitrilysin family protein [Patescibacteria group bacterium]
MGAELYHLSNGIPVAIDVMPHVETASLGMFFNIGTRFETKQTNGAAHFLEHMFFKGTDRRTAQQVSAEAENNGIDIGAYTTHEETFYEMSGLATDVPKMIDLMADMVLHSKLPYKELKTERGAILQEIAQDGNDLESAVDEAARKMAYPKQPFGADILGPRKNVREMSRKTLMDFMKAHYHAGNMIISIAGKVDPQAVLADLEKAVGHLPPREKSVPEPAVYKGGYKHIDCLAAQFHLKLLFNSCAGNAPEYWATSLLATVMGGGMSSRLFQEIRNKRGLVYDVSAFNQASRDTGTFQIYAATDHKDVKKLVPLLCAEIVKMRDSGITEQELERAKKQALVQLAEMSSGTQSRMETMADQVTYFGRLQSNEEIAGQINAVTVEQVNAVAKRIFSGTPTLATAGSYRRAASYENVLNLLPPPP